jgi:phenylacetic acid degradation operon negative regulatory protein
MERTVARLIDRLESLPSHTGSMIITIFGDSIAPRGGAVALRTVIDLCGAMALGPGSVRTAISRAAADGWLAASRRGRASFYRIAGPRRGEFVRAARHIFGPTRGAGATRLTLVLTEPGDQREAARDRLTRLGFVAWQGVMLAPERPLPRALAESLEVLQAEARPEVRRTLAARAWRLEPLAERYRDFVEAHAPLAEAAARLTPLDAMLARTLLVHDYRRIVLRDPRLPPAFLAPDWPGEAARRLCRETYPRLLPAAETWLDRFGATEDGMLPPPETGLFARFGAGGAASRPG